MALKGQYHPVKDFNYNQAQNFVKANDLKYYNEDLHTAVFTLPTFVRKMLENSK